jgi:hypothetical protein
MIIPPKEQEHTRSGRRQGRLCDDPKASLFSFGSFDDGLKWHDVTFLHRHLHFADSVPSGQPLNEDREIGKLFQMRS